MIFFILLILTGLFFYYHLYYKRLPYPPGPMPVPLLGNMVELALNEPGEDAHLKWHKRFGPIHTVWFGELPVINITDYKLMVEMFQRDGDAYSGRAYCMKETQEFWSATRNTKAGVVCSENELWLKSRKFMYQTLRRFGMGKDLMQQKILAEVERLTQRIDLKNDQGVAGINLPEMFDLSIGSVIYSVILGECFDKHNIHMFKQLKTFSNMHMNYVLHPFNLIQQKNFHLYKNLPGFRHYQKVTLDGWSGMMNFFDDQIREHKEFIDSIENLDSYQATDLIYQFLKEWRQKLGDDEDLIYNDQNLKVICIDSWLAGQDTVSTTLAWTVIYSVCWPECQQKLQEELDKVVGSDRLICLSDKDDLPYVNAFINETQRLANILATNLIHQTTRDVNVNGFNIPKGTAIIPQISAVLHSKEIFEDPKVFNPGRFLDESGQLKQINERQCVGESLAKAELFLMIANLFNQYRILPHGELPSLKRKFGVTTQHLPYKVQLTKRY
ncbi:Unspecific monooxygenase [Aphelenchoides bicaudatus]|nr:Unspecific monooxygenase [Aphelenchoides bicaudatus]